MRSRNPVGDFNTAGQGKCPHCGDYYPSAWVVPHIDGCAKNPANVSQANTSSDEQPGS